MKDSIIVNPKYQQYDVVDGNPNTERHHVFEGIKWRGLADEDGLWLPLTPTHHRDTKCGAHSCKFVKSLLHIIGQLAYEKHEVANGLTEDEARAKFMRRYGQSFL